MPPSQFPSVSELPLPSDRYCRYPIPLPISSSSCCRKVSHERVHYRSFASTRTQTLSRSAVSSATGACSRHLVLDPVIRARINTMRTKIALGRATPNTRRRKSRCVPLVKVMAADQRKSRPDRAASFQVWGVRVVGMAELVVAAGRGR